MAEVALTSPLLDVPSAASVPHTDPKESQCIAPEAVLQSNTFSHPPGSTGEDALEKPDSVHESDAESRTAAANKDDSSNHTGELTTAGEAVDKDVEHSSSGSSDSDAEGSPEPEERESPKSGGQKATSLSSTSRASSTEQPREPDDDEMVELLKRFKDRGKLDSLLKRLSVSEEKKSDQVVRNGVGDGTKCTYAQCGKTFNRPCELKLV